MSKRCLMVYSGNFEETSDAARMLSYSRALRDAGYRFASDSLKDHVYRWMLPLSLSVGAGFPVRTL